MLSSGYREQCEMDEDHRQRSVVGQVRRILVAMKGWCNWWRYLWWTVCSR